MEAASARDRIILQSDWDQALRERYGKAWLCYKTGAPPSDYSELSGHGLSPEGLPYLTAKDEQFSVSEIKRRSLVISYNGEHTSLSRKFVAPMVTFSKIHTPKKQVTCVDTSTGGLGVSCDSDGNLNLWQTDTGEVRRQFVGHVAEVYTCRFFPSGIVVLSAGMDMMAKIWSAETGQCAATITGHRAGILDTAIVDKGRNIVTASRDGTAKLWDVGQQECLATFEEIGGEVNSCCLGVPENSIDLGSPSQSKNEREVFTEGKLLLLGCENKTLQGFGLESREKIFDFSCESAVNTCAFISERLCVCGTQDGHIYAVDLRNTDVPLAAWKESRGPILSLLAHKGGFFPSTGDGSCFHVNEQFETTTEVTGPDCDPVYSVSSDGTNIYTSCRDGAIRRYNLSHIV